MSRFTLPKTGDNTAKFITDLLSDIQSQPEWRAEHATCEAYYDGLQLRPDVVEAMEERGQPVIINNLIKPTIDGVLGMEAKARTDWQVRADDEQGALVNEFLNERLCEAARMANADRAIADAFARQVKGGIGFIEVRKNDDPFADPFIVEEIDWANMHWDFRSRRPDFKDCRYMVCERWMDEDEAELVAPKHMDILRASINGMLTRTPEQLGDLSPNLVSALNTVRSTNLTESEWLDFDRKRVRIFDVYYRRPQYGKVMISGEQKVLFNPQNPLHMRLAKAGHVQVVDSRFYRMYRALFAGIHMIHHGPSPYPHNEFPWVPFVGFREGRSRIPYGLIRGMLSPQNEVNFRRSMLTWLLKARRIVMDADATKMSDRELHAAVARVDGIIKLDPARKNKDASAFRIESEINIAAQQFQVMQDAEQQIQSVAGVYNAMLGRNDGAQSGLAINSLVEQGSVTLSELFDNYRFAKQQTGELLLALVAEDIGNEQKKVQIYVNDHMRKPKELVINEETETGEVNNKVTLLGKHVVLADIQSTPGYRAQMLERLMALAQTLPDNLKVVLLEDIIDLSELPRRGELLKKLRRAMGVGVEPDKMDEAERQEYMAKQQQEQIKLAVEMALQQAAAREATARAAKTEAEAQLTQAKVQTEDQQAPLLAVKAQEILQRIEAQRTQLAITERQASNDASNQLEDLIDQMMATATGRPLQPTTMTEI